MEKYFKFDGVATRSEYWGVMIIATLLAFVFGLFGGFALGFGGSAGSVLGTIFGGLVLLATIVASAWVSIATCVRRCRDAGINVWWTLGVYVPYIGWIVAIVIGCLKTETPVAVVTKPETNANAVSAGE